MSSDNQLPSKLGGLSRAVIVAVKRNHAQFRKSGFSTEQIFDVIEKMLEKSAPDTIPAKIKISSTLSSLRARGWFAKTPEGWSLTEAGSLIVENIDDIPEVGSAKKKRPALDEISPIQSTFTPNLSKSAENLASSLGALLDDNQAYRDFLKAQLNQIADFLGAKIIYTENRNDSTKED